MVGAGVRTAVHAQLEPLDVLPKRSSSRSTISLHLRLGLGDGVVAERLAGAADAGAAHTVDVQREADLREPPDDLVDARSPGRRSG